MRYLKQLIGLLLVLFSVSAMAETRTFIGSLVTVNNDTNTSSSVTVGTFDIPSIKFFIQNGGITGTTNALKMEVQLSMDDSNFVTVATYNPRHLAATNDTFIPTLTSRTVFMRTRIITTNSVNVGGTYQQ